MGTSSSCMHARDSHNEAERQVEVLQDEVKTLKSLLASGGTAGSDAECKRICSKMFVNGEDLKKVVSRCSRIQAEFLPGNELKLPRCIEVKASSTEEVIEIICPGDTTRLNLAAVFARFMDVPGTALCRWTPLKGLISWSALQGRFEYVLEHFVRHLPCGADKTISQMLTAIFERGRRGGSAMDIGAPGRWEEVMYLAGVSRHTATTPFMPFALWTAAAVFTFAHSMEKNATAWVQGMLADSSLRVANGTFHGGGVIPKTLQPASEEVRPEACVDIAIAAGGGSDVVAATAWLAHIGAPEGSVLFQPGRGKPQDYGLQAHEVLVPVPDHSEPLSKGKQFYEGTALAGRTQHLSKHLGLAYRYYFLLQDKNMLGSGSTVEVLEHMNNLVDGIHSTVSKFARCARIHLVDSGGDVLSAVLATSKVNLDEFSGPIADSVAPRKERDVWSLLLAMALQARFSGVDKCELQLVVMAPGVDGQSVWLGPQPKAASMSTE